MKKGKILGLLAISAVMLTGCVDSMPEMTKEQSDLVAEYAAGLLLKYSPNYAYRLVEEVESEAETALEEQQTEPESEKSEETDGGELKQADKEKVDTEEQTAMILCEDIDTNLASELGLNEGISMYYQSFEICSSYPKETSGFSGVDAKEGKTLLVLHFEIENSTNEDVECRLDEAALNLRVNVNNSESAWAMDDMIMLPDDIISFSESIKAGEKSVVTAITEIDEIQDDEIETLTVQVSSLNGTCGVQVR